MDHIHHVNVSQGRYLLFSTDIQVVDLIIIIVFFHHHSSFLEWFAEDFRPEASYETFVMNNIFLKRIMEYFDVEHSGCTRIKHYP